MLPGPCRIQRDPAGGEEEKQQEQDFSVPPALATAESLPRDHTASRRDHVTDTEHDFPVWGDGQAGLTPPTSNIYVYNVIYVDLNRQSFVFLPLKDWIATRLVHHSFHIFCQ